MSDPVLTVANTHIYPGVHGDYGDAPYPLPKEGLDIWVSFSDGVGTWGFLAPLPGPRCKLQVTSFVTSAGQRIPSKIWILERTGAGAGFRVRDHGEASRGGLRM